MKAKDLLNGYRDRNAKRVLVEAVTMQNKYPDTDGIPPITERGHGKAAFKVGDMVVTTGTGQLVAGVVLKVTDVWFTNGFPKYATGTIVHGDGELEKI